MQNFLSACHFWCKTKWYGNTSFVRWYCLCLPFFSWTHGCHVVTHAGHTLLCMIDSCLCLLSHLFSLLQKSSACYKVSHSPLCVVVLVVVVVVVILVMSLFDHSVSFGCLNLKNFSSFNQSWAINWKFTNIQTLWDIKQPCSCLHVCSKVFPHDFKIHLK